MPGIGASMPVSRLESEGFPSSWDLVELAGAVSETLTFRFWLEPQGQPIRNPDLHVSALSGGGARIESSAIEIFRMHPVPVDRWPGWHIRAIPPEQRDPNPLDVLVPIHAPRGGLANTLWPGERYDFWVDLSIPKGTFDGVYTGEIELRSQGRRIAGVAIQLTVWPLILPVDADVTVIAELDHRRLFRHHIRNRGRPYAPSVDDWRHDPLRDRLDLLLDSTMRLLRRHRLTPVLPQLAPIVKFGAGGELAIDWDQYDAVVAPCLSGELFRNRTALRHWPLPFDRMISAKRQPDALRAASHQETLERYMTACARHFSRLGWLKRSYAMVSGTATSLERVDPSASLTRFAKIARRADPRIPILARLFPQDLRPYGALVGPVEDVSGFVDIWMPPAQFFDPAAMSRQRKSGRRTWMTVGRPPFSGSTAIQAPSTSTRVLTWLAEEVGCEALFLGSVNDWPDAAHAPTPEDCVMHDAHVLLYPGGPFGLDEPVPSVRLKRLRRSLQDAAYLRVLREHGLEHVVTTLRRSLAPIGGSDAYCTHFADGQPIAWPHDPRMFEQARRIMADELINAAQAALPRRPAATLARTVAWRRFMAASRKLRLCVDGVRVRFVGSPGEREAEVQCALTITNRTRVPAAGVIRFVELPAGWTTAEEEQAIPTIPPNESRRVSLTALATVIPTESGGHLSLPIELTTADGEVVRVEARVACVTPAEPRGVLTIDGDLSDWPIGTTNVASNFLLIAGGSPNASARARPRRDTTAFVLRDGEFLYLGVNSQLDESDAPGETRRSGVQYDDMVPVGEDLIEVLLDPLNAGTRSPSDLYHIVIKRSGPYVIEKGILLDPPCGERSPWPVDLEYASSGSPGRWTVELRIPLEAFGAVQTHQTTWGMNITRFDKASQEFSTWSGAVGNAYDPLSLGNLHLP
ncbi:MAG: DUF4091 domain-containing protein [Planctomycetes bacterium]|nr:DUF4091 domain-containing protein [Planctomycetota bacterium]